MDLPQALQLWLARLLDPLVAAGRSSLYRRDLLAALGVDETSAGELPLAELVEALAVCGAAVETVLALDLDDPSLATLSDLLDEAGTAVEAVSQVVAKMAELDPATIDPEQLLGDLLSFLTVKYLFTHAPVAYDLAALLSLIRVSEDGDKPFPRAEFAQLPALISDPAGLLSDYYLGPGGLAGLQSAEQARQASDRLMPRLAAILGRLGLNAHYLRDPRLSLPEEPGVADRLLALQWPLGPAAGVGLALSLRSVEEGGAAVLVVPTGVLGFTYQSQDWTITSAVQGQLNGLAFGPGGVEWPAGQEDLTVRAELMIGKRPGPGGLAFRSSSAGTRLEVGSVQLHGYGLFGADYDVGFLVELKRAALVASAPAGDGFLQRILPAEGLQADFELAFGWSLKKGLYFQGGAGLETSLPVQADLLGILSVNSVDLAIRTQGNELVGMVASTATVKLGPLTAVVEKMGLEARLSFPEQGGNLGLAQLSLDFKPPSGAALSVKAAAVEGGGYLFFDPARHQYAGILELELGGKIALKAVGLITTRLPDGSPGFSLFVLITAEGFEPIPLGMGFTLNGVGGLLGLNRTVMTEVLRQGLKRNTLDSVLFPADPVANAPTVISNLSAVFPPAANRFLFGPMAILGWGTPTLLTLKLAVILEIPDPVRLIILGRLSVTLPDPEHPIVRIQLDAIGELNFQKGTVSLDGALFDSRLLDFVLTGSMALRASWGEQPFFLLSIGGFNPRFPVPAGIPRLERLALSLSSSPDLRLRLEGYLALTANTAQFGARLELFAKSGALSLEGYLGYDTFIQFNPFGFIADVAAGVALRYNDKLVAGIYLALTIAGPTPWHIKGTAKIQVLFLSYSVDIDYRFGPAVPPPLPEPVDVGLLLRQALNNPDNWSSELPGTEHPLVTLRAVSGAGVSAHPLGRLMVRQQVVPLNFTITRFGTTMPTQERHFQVQVLVINSTLSVQPDPVEEYFALGQFRNLSEDEKLSRPSFEKMEAGFQFGSDGFDYNLALGFESPIDYETVMVDPADPSAAAVQGYRPSPPALNRLALEGAAGQSAFRDTSRY